MSNFSSLKKKKNNLRLKSRSRTFIKKFKKYLSIDFLDKAYFYYKMYIKNLDIIFKKNIFKKNKVIRLKKSISLYFKNFVFN